MSSKDAHKKHKNNDYRSRSRSRSPESRSFKKERTHRSEKHADHRSKHRPGGEEEFGHKKIKSEPSDKGYRKYENLGTTEDTRERSNRFEDKKRERDRHAERRDHRREQPQVQIKQEQDRERNDHRRRENRRERGDENPFQMPAGDTEDGETAQATKEGPNFGLSGALTEDTNTFRGVVIKYNEPPEARKPKLRWRLYVFKGEEELPTLYIHRQSAFLLGRERLIADIPIDHPSCSKQHAVIQYRLVEYDKANGTKGKRVRPYIIDLESANGTFLNNKQIESKRYYELQEKDMVKFGFSSREYVVLHEKTSTAELNDEGEL